VVDNIFGTGYILSAICGYWALRGESDPSKSLAHMLAVQDAHGPDGHSVLNLEGISFGHQLLKITAEDGFEAQPLVFQINLSHSRSAAAVLVADARIYNRAQLGHEMDLRAAEMDSLPDSAFVLKAWQRWGQDCVQHLIGAFSFAVWDGQSRQLFLARDHAGERPLYFIKTAFSFAFASSARALLVCPGVSGELDETTLAHDLIGLPPQPFRTRFRDVRTVLPGHCMLVSENDAEVLPGRYWSYDRLPPTRFSRDQDYVDAFLEIFDEAVLCRLRTTGEIASDLSAGLDSGSVTATAARLMAGTDKRLTAFTAVPCAAFSGVIRRDCIADEGPYAAEVARLYPNIDHRLVDSSGSDMVREMERSFAFLDGPLGAPLNQIWINLILDQVVGAGANVLLTGALGNATISYSGGDIIRESFRRGHWLKAFRQAVELRRSGVSSGRAAASLTFLSLLPWALRTRLDPSMRGISLEHSAILPERGRALNLVDQIRRYGFLSKSGLPPLMDSFFHASVPGDFDLMANSGWGIELRDPTADKRVFEYCASIPLEQYMVDKPGRSLIRRAMHGRLPDSTLDRRERGLQAADWYESLTRVRAEIAAEIVLLERSPGARRLLDLDRLRSAVDHWPNSAREAEDQGMLYPAILPDGIAVGYFIRRSEELAG
jgi:asparagine synthase (glutamine-hydrolysing)